MRDSPRALLLTLTLLVLAGCVEDVSAPVVFDVVLESTTFVNRLRTPVAIIRNGLVIDTLAAGTTRIYPIGHRGPVRHSWRVIAPEDDQGRKWSEEPMVNLGIQYRVDEQYRIDNGAPEQTIFTPRISNFTFERLRLIVNEGEDDERSTNYVIPPNSLSELTHAPYFYWNSSSNVVLQSLSTSRDWRFSRSDSGDAHLELDDSYFGGDDTLDGAGVTKPLRVE